MTLTAHLVVPDAEQAAAWYATAFGARERSRIPLPNGRLMSVELELAEGVVHLGSEFRDFGILAPQSIGGTATVLQINCGDVDALWRRALAAGANIRHPLADAFWGERHGQIEDPFGHRWNLAQRVREVPHAEIVAAAAAVFGG